MDIREATYILEIEKTQNLTTAADNLYITQPALSKMLKKLETEFNTSLFYKDGRYLLPTEVGKIVLKHSRKIVREYEEMTYAVNRMTQQNDPPLRLGIALMSAFWYQPLISAFCEEHPEIVFNLIENGGNDLKSMLSKEMLDIAIAPPFDSPDNNEVPLFASELCVAVDASHPWANKEVIYDDDFEGQTYITFTSDAIISTQISNRFHDKGIHASQKQLGKELIWLIQCARNMNIPCIFPKMSLAYYAWPTMVTIPFHPVFPWGLSMITPKNKKLSKNAKTFVRFVEDYFSSHAESYLVSKENETINLAPFIAY